MARIRKLVLAIAAASALSSGVAHALGLGEISLQSALNQPLVAEIELLDVRSLTSTEVMPSLASAEEFQRAGVDRPFFLNDLQFSPVITAQGKSIIRISSSKPVREPYLNFLVEVHWPSGRALREYTVLLDPPLYNPQNSADVAPQLAVAAPTAQPQSQSAARAPQPTRSAPSTVRPVAPQPERQSEYRTVAHDTLWEIAARHQRGNATVQQTMLAIQDLNPSAFINDNINLLKTGQVLRLPDEQQIAARTRREAIARVAEQNAAWQAWRQARSQVAGERQLDATRRTAAGAAPAQVELGDSLRLVAGSEGRSAEGQDTGNPDALADKLAVAQENLDTSRRASAELEGRMGDLQSQLDKLQRLIELKDSQLARLQSRLAEEEQAAQQAPEATTEPAPAASEAPQQNPAASDQPVAAPEEARSDDAAPSASAAPLQGVIEQPAPAPAEVLQSVVPVVDPAQPAANEPGLQGYVDRLLADPLLLGAIGGGSLLALLLALMALSRRNALKEAELQEGLGLSDDDQAFSEELALPSSSFDDLGGVSRNGKSGAKADEAVDVLGEANIYIAYGRFNQAAELLLNTLDEQPERRDLRLKLMEVFAEQGDRAGFQQQEAELREVGGADSEIRQLKSRYPDIAQAPVAAPVAAGALAVGATAGAVALTDWQDTQEEPLPSLDELSFDDELQVSAPLAAPTASNDFDKPLPDFDALDFDLQLDSEPSLGDLPVAEPVAPASVPADKPVEPEPEALSDLEFTLDDPFESLESFDDEGVENEDDLPELELPTLNAIETPGREAELSMLPEDFDLSLAEAEQLLSGDEPEPSAVDDFEAELERVNAQLDTLTDELEMPAVEPPPFDITDLGPLEDDEDFDFLSGTNETATKLDLARAYIDMGDSEGARDILDEVLGEGDDSQKNEARELMARLS